MPLQEFSFTTSAPGKVILHGEHSVVYGKLAIAASLGLRTFCVIKNSSNNNFLTVTLPELEYEEKSDLEDLELNLLEPASKITQENPEEISQKDLENLVEKYLCSKSLSNVKPTIFNALKSFFFLLSGIISSKQVKLPAINIKISTQLKIGAGTGSSASYNVAIAASLLKLHSTLNNKQFVLQEHLQLISNWAFNAEKIIHGTPSGIDNTICTFGGMVQFTKGSPAKLLITPQIKLLLINTEVPRETKKLVEKVANLRRENPQKVDQILASMDQIAWDSIKFLTKTSLEKQDFKHLTDLSAQNHALLRQIEVSHEKLEEIIEILLQFGLKGKLTGAGGGGYAICLVPEEFEGKIEFVINTLQEAGFPVCLTDLGGPGVSVNP